MPILHTAVSLNGVLCILIQKTRDAQIREKNVIVIFLLKIVI